MTRKLYAALFLALALMCALPAVGAIAFDNASSAQSADGASSLTFAHTVNSNANGVLFVGIGYYDSTITVASVTYGGAGLTFIRRDASVAAAGIKNEIWYLKAPATGAHNVVVTMTGALGAQVHINAGGISVTGVDQSNPLAAHNGAGSTTIGTVASVTVTTAVDGCWVLESTSSGLIGGPGTTWSSAETQDWDLENTTVNNRGVANGAHFGPKTPAGAQAMSETTSWSAGLNWAISAAAFAPVATPPRRRPAQVY